MHNFFRSMPLLACTMCSLLIQPQSHALADTSNNKQPSQLQEVVVYASLDQRALKDLAASVSVWSGDELRSRNARHIDQLLGTAPNVNFSGGASRGRFVQIRGVGDIEQFVDPKAYPSVGFIVDGIELNGIFGAGLLFDVDQVEILRGPQGTRLGASALAGAINIRSLQPGENHPGYVELGAGKFSSYQTGTAIDAKFNNAVSARFALQGYRSDGYIDNRFLNRDNTGKFDELGAKLNLHWNASDNQQLHLTALHIDNNNGYDAFSLDNTRHTTVSDQPGHDRQRLWALAITHQVQFANNTSLHSKITGLQARLDYGFDEDWINGSFCGTQTNCLNAQFSSTDRYRRERDEYSVDIRLAGADFVAGLYTQKRNVQLDRNYTFAADFRSDYALDRFAVYGQWTPTLTDTLSASLGARFEIFRDDYRDLNALKTKTDDELWSLDASLSYAIAGHTDLFALLARGNKAGGVNTDASSNIGFATPGTQAELMQRLRYSSESLTNIELGSDSRWLNNTLTSRLSLFYNQRNSPQFETFLLDFPPPSGFLFIGYQDNAGSAESHGIEWQLEFRPTSIFSLNANLAYIKSTFKQLRAYDFDLFTFVDIDAKQAPRAPSYQYHLQARLGPQQGWSGTLAVEGRDSYQYAYYFDAQTKPSNLAHASVEYNTPQYNLTLWVRNLRDADYAVQGLYFANDPRDEFSSNKLYTQAGEPRNFGATFRYNF